MEDVIDDWGGLEEYFNLWHGIYVIL